MKKYSADYFEKKFRILFQKLIGKEGFIKEVKKSRKKLGLPENGFNNETDLALYFIGKMNKREELMLSMIAFMDDYHKKNNPSISDENTDMVNHLINEMNKVDLRKSFDFTRSRYINDGQSLYAHTRAHELIIYDKVSDLGKDRKRAIDKKQTPYQKNLFAELKKDTLIIILA